MFGLKLVRILPRQTMKQVSLFVFYFSKSIFVTFLYNLSDIFLCVIPEHFPPSAVKPSLNVRPSALNPLKRCEETSQPHKYSLSSEHKQLLSLFLEDFAAAFKRPTVIKHIATWSFNQRILGKKNKNYFLYFLCRVYTSKYSFIKCSYIR